MKQKCFWYNIRSVSYLIDECALCAVSMAMQGRDFQLMVLHAYDTSQHVVKG